MAKSEFILQKEAELVGLEYVTGTYVSSTTKIPYKCIEGTHADTLTSSEVIRRDKKGCRACLAEGRYIPHQIVMPTTARSQVVRKTDSALKAEARAVGLKFRPGSFTGMGSLADYTCKKHGLIRMSPVNVYTGAGCVQCGHERNIISEKQLAKEAKAVGLKYMKGTYIGISSLTTYVCKAHGPIRLKSESIRNYTDYQHCEACRSDDSEALLQEQADAVQLTYVKGAHTTRTIADYDCSKHGRVHLTSYDVSKGRTCYICRAEEYGIEFLDHRTEKDLYKKNIVLFAHYRCPEHGRFRRSVESARLCSPCAGTLTEFTPDVPAFVYFMRTEEFCGFGITHHLLPRLRVIKNQLRRRGMPLLEVKYYHIRNGDNAWALERHIQTLTCNKIIRTGMKGFDVEALPVKLSNRVIAALEKQAGTPMRDLDPREINVR